MDVRIQTALPDEIDAAEIAATLTEIGYYVNSVWVNGVREYDAAAEDEDDHATLDHLRAAIYAVTEAEWHASRRLGGYPCFAEGPHGFVCSRAPHDDGWHVANGATTLYETWLEPAS